MRMTKQNRMNKIISVAIDVIARDGFKSASTKEIAKLAGCTEALVFKYFKTKDEILYHILQTIYQENDSQFESFFQIEKTLIEFILSITFWIIDNYSEKRNLYKVILSQEFSDRDFAKNIYEHHQIKRWEPIVKELERRQKLGKIKPEINVHMFGQMIMEILGSIGKKVIFLEWTNAQSKKYYADLFEFIAKAV